MAVLPLRLLGIVLLALAILIPSCQAVFSGDEEPRQFNPGFIQD